MAIGGGITVTKDKQQDSKIVALTERVDALEGATPPDSVGFDAFCFSDDILELQVGIATSLALLEIFEKQYSRKWRYRIRDWYRRRR